jgi:hypothetical protein
MGERIPPWRTPTEILAIEDEALPTNMHLEITIGEVWLNNEKVRGMNKCF